MAGDRYMCGTTVLSKDEKLKTFWESSGISYGGFHEVVVRSTYSHFDKQMLFPLVFLVNAGP